MDYGDDYLNNLWYLTMFYLNASQREKYPGRFSHGLWSWSRDGQPWNYYFHQNQQKLNCLGSCPPWFLHDCDSPISRILISNIFLPGGSYIVTDGGIGVWILKYTGKTTPSDGAIQADAGGNDVDTGNSNERIVTAKL